MHPEWLNLQSKWNDNFVNAFAGSPLQTEPVVASIFASPKYNAAFKTASAVAGLAKPNLPYTMLETRDALQHRSRCPFASKLVEQHNNHQKELAQSLERNLAKCSTKFAPVKEDAWQENGGV